MPPCTMGRVRNREKCFVLICAACDRSVELQAFQMSYILATLLRVFRRTTSYVAITSLSKPSFRVLKVGGCSLFP